MCRSITHLTWHGKFASVLLQWRSVLSATVHCSVHGSPGSRFCLYPAYCMRRRNLKFSRYEGNVYKPSWTHNSFSQFTMSTASKIVATADVGRPKRLSEKHTIVASFHDFENLPHNGVLTCSPVMVCHGHSWSIHLSFQKKDVL